MAKRPKRLNLDVLRFFFDPHPGFAGAAIPIPAEVKKIANMMNATKTSLRKAKDRIQAVTEGRVFIRNGWIGLELNDPAIDSRRHFFRVIRFR